MLKTQYFAVLYLELLVSLTYIQSFIKIGYKLAELWAKYYMPKFGHTQQILKILAHKLGKYQYFWMKPTLYKS